MCREGSKTLALFKDEGRTKAKHGAKGSGLFGFCDTGS